MIYYKMMTTTGVTIQEPAINIVGLDEDCLYDAIPDAISILHHVVDRPQTCTIVTYAHWQCWPVNINK